MAKSTKIIAALGVAGMLGGIALPTFAATETVGITDKLSVTIDPVCGFKSSTYTGEKWAAASKTTGGAANIDNTLSDTILNGESLTGSHEMKVVCNEAAGFAVKVTNPAALVSDAEDSEGNNPEISYNAAAAAGTEGYYVGITLDTAGGAELVSSLIQDGKLKGANASATAIIKNEGASADTTFTVTYMIGTNSTTPAGTYTGDVVYTLVSGVNN